MKRAHGTPLEPKWRTWTHQPVAGLPAAVAPWLRDTGSLTRRVIESCDGDFRVRLLRQRWGRPFDSERRLLGSRSGIRALIREVELWCGGEPWVFARSVIPATSLHGPARRLASLGERPLGAVLFADPRVRRGDTQVARLLPRHPLFQVAVRDLDAVPSELWGRRTLYRFAGHPLLVNEIFLPAIP